MLKVDNVFPVFLIFMSVFSNSLSAQQVEETPEKVYRYCYVVKPKEWYKNRERLWKMELSKNPENEDAWYSYFFAARYGWANVKGQTNTREVLMESIYHEMLRRKP